MLDYLNVNTIVLNGKVFECLKVNSFESNAKALDYLNVNTIEFNGKICLL